MSEELFGSIKFGGGSGWNPTARPDDDPYRTTVHFIYDLITVLRGTKPNRHLGNADEYIWAGEWELAVGTIEAVLQHERAELTELEAEVLRRAKTWINRPD